MRRLVHNHEALRYWPATVVCATIAFSAPAFAQSGALDAPPTTAGIASHADLPATPPTKLVRAELRVVTLPQKEALDLLPQFDDEHQSPAAFAKVEAMIAKGEATLVGIVIAKTGDGRIAVAESAEEYRYGTEFELPQKFAEREQLKEPKSRSLVPVAFETRDLGLSLEITPTVVSGGRYIHCHVRARHTRLREVERFDCGLSAAKEILFVEQPQFWSATDEGTLVLQNEQRTLLGVHKMPDAPERLELFFLQIKSEPAP